MITHGEISKIKLAIRFNEQQFLIRAVFYRKVIEKEALQEFKAIGVKVGKNASLKGEYTCTTGNNTKLN